MPLNNSKITRPGTYSWFEIGQGGVCFENLAILSVWGWNTICT